MPLCADVVKLGPNPNWTVLRTGPGVRSGWNNLLNTFQFKSNLLCWFLFLSVSTDLNVFMWTKCSWKLSLITFLFYFLFQPDGWSF